jgi:DNA-binding transcriptional ArsR family regulator
VAELLEQGLSFAEVAGRLGLSRPTVSYHARRLGIPAEERYACRYDWDEVQEYYEAGNSISACQLRFGFARKTFMDAVRRGLVVTRPQTAPLATYLVAGRRVNRHHLKGRLLAAGLKRNACEVCGIDRWRGEPLSLALHHVNGDGLDNRLENLMLLCPNCHSQTDNFSGRKRRRLAA